MHRRVVVVRTPCIHDSLLSMIPQLSLDDPSRREVALYRRTTSGCFDILGVKSTKPCLEISPEVEHMLDLVILTFIYVEKLRMDKELEEVKEKTGKVR